jgi:hypothetical protein
MNDDIERHRITEEEETKRQRNREREETKRADIAGRSASPAWGIAQAIKLAGLITACLTAVSLYRTRVESMRPYACKDSAQSGDYGLQCAADQTGRLEGNKLLCTCIRPVTASPVTSK